MPAGTGRGRALRVPAICSSVLASGRSGADVGPVRTRKGSPEEIAALLQLDRRRPRSLPEQIFVSLRDAIALGRIRAGERLPGTRELAQAAGVSRNTVLHAYEELRRQAIVDSCVGSGTVVGKGAAKGIEPQGERPGGSGPLPARKWARAIRSAFTKPAADLREVLADYLAVRGIICRPRHIIITSNPQQSRDLALRAVSLLRREMFVEDPAGDDVRKMCALASMIAVRLPVDLSGANIAAALRESSTVAAAYVTPAHQNPLGVALASDRREALLQWASRVSAWIVEDEVPATLRRLQERPMYATSGRILNIGTLGYPLSPFSRLSYLIVPDALQERLADMEITLGAQASVCEQATVRRLLLSRTYQRTLHAMRCEAEERHRVIATTAARELMWFVTRVAGTETGERAVIWLHDRYDASCIARRLRKHRIAAQPLQAYSVAPVRDAIVLRLDAVRTEHLSPVLLRVSQLVREWTMHRARGTSANSEVPRRDDTVRT